jgi:hypothetical protein
VGRTPFKQAIAVFTGSKPTVAAGDSVTVAGTVSEFFPDQSDTPSALPVAEIDDPVVTVVSTGNPLPAPVIIGSRGVLPPAQNILTPLRTRSADVDTVPTFAPALRALDFYQGLDSALVAAASCCYQRLGGAARPARFAGRWSSPRLLAVISSGLGCRHDPAGFGMPGRAKSCGIMELPRREAVTRPGPRPCPSR